MEKKYCPSCRWFRFNPYGEDGCFHTEGRHVTGVLYTLLYLRSTSGPCGPDGRLYEKLEETSDKIDSVSKAVIVGFVAIILALGWWVFHA